MTDEVTKEESNGKAESEENVGNYGIELDAAIIRQIEYYFGDINLPRDKFLNEQVKLDDGWVPLEVLITFNRLANLSKDTDVIAKALQKSTTGLVEISDDNKKVRRNPELPLLEMTEERRKELMDRTVYAKGFPKDVTLDELLQYFKEHGDVENVIMRRFPDRATKKRGFKGSVFATFKDKEQAQKFLDLEEVKYKDTTLLRHWQHEYLHIKHVEYANKKEKKDKKNKDKEEKAEEKKEELKLPTGTVLHFGEGNEKMTREDIKNALTELGAEIAYVDFKVGDKEGWVRLSKEDSAKVVFEKITDGKLKITEAEVPFDLLEGDAESAYLTKTIEEIHKRRQNQSKNKHQKGRFNKAKHGGKRRNGPAGDVPAKKVKTD